MVPSFLLIDFAYIITSLLFLLTVYAWRFYCSRGKLWYASTKANLHILNACPSILKGYFSPAIYLTHFLLQSKFATFLPSQAEHIIFDIEEFKMAKGGYTGIGWPKNITLRKTNSKRAKVLVLILPGVTGSAGDNYIKDLIDLLSKDGYECVVYLPRFNCKSIVLPDEGHMDIVADFRETLEYIVKKKPDMKIFGLGHSYGANLLVNYLGQTHDERFIGLVSIANPLNFILSEVRVRGKLIEKAVTGALLRNINRSRETLEAVSRFGLDIDGLQLCRTMKSFDGGFSTKVYGHETSADFHWEISSIRRLKHVKLPIFMLSAEDDPIIDPMVITREEVEKDCPNVIYKTTPNGGHLGWIQGFFKLTRWYSKPTVEYINAVVDMKMN